ncbi:MAG: hypothetical protein PHW10_00575 [Candidatus Peribacteraceae bacterium]|nr:hypothetical protein [Candidatus Peribacteraceae bacterium]
MSHCPHESRADASVMIGTEVRPVVSCFHTLESVIDLGTQTIRNGNGDQRLLTAIAAIDWRGRRNSLLNKLLADEGINAHVDRQGVITFVDDECGETKAKVLSILNGPHHDVHAVTGTTAAA